jgi:DNA-directed RNA polymerase specialized sigma24 family protein
MSGPAGSVYGDDLDAVYGYLVYRHGSRRLAEDLTQATFERASRGDGDVRRDPRGSRIALLALARDVSAAAPVAPGDDGTMAPDLAAGLSALDRGERTVLALRFGARLRPGEIAGMLDLTDRRVRQVLSRGLRRVRTELERESRGGGQQDHA